MSMDLERLGDEWHQQLQQEFMENIAENIRIRVKAIERIANRLVQEAIHSPPPSEHFEIDSDVYGEIMRKLKPEIGDKSKVQVSECRIKKDTFKDYRTTARNRLNRNKPKFLGNFVFAHLLFDKLYTYILRHGRQHHLDDLQLITLFIDILVHIFDAKVNFTQTKPLPVIPYKCLVDGNELKSACINLLKYYSVSLPPASPQETNKKAKQSEKAKKDYDRIVQTIKVQLKKPEVLTARPLPIRVFVQGNDYNAYSDWNSDANQVRETNMLSVPSQCAQPLRVALDRMPSGNSLSDESSATSTTQLPLSHDLPPAISPATDENASNNNNHNTEELRNMYNGDNITVPNYGDRHTASPMMPQMNHIMYPEDANRAYFNSSNVQNFAAASPEQHYNAYRYPDVHHAHGAEFSAHGRVEVPVVDDVQNISGLPFNPHHVVYGAPPPPPPQAPQAQLVHEHAPQHHWHGQAVQMPSIAVDPTTSSHVGNVYGHHDHLPVAYGAVRGSAYRYTTASVRHSPYRRPTRPETLVAPPWSQPSTQLYVPPRPRPFINEPIPAPHFVAPPPQYEYYPLPPPAPFMHGMTYSLPRPSSSNMESAPVFNMQ